MLASALIVPLPGAKYKPKPNNACPRLGCENPPWSERRVSRAEKSFPVETKLHFCDIYIIISQYYLFFRLDYLSVGSLGAWGYNSIK
jgi:hypothetical protein